MTLSTRREIKRRNHHPAAQLHHSRVKDHCRNLAVLSGFPQVEKAARFPARPTLPLLLGSLFGKIFVLDLSRSDARPFAVQQGTAIPNRMIDTAGDEARKIAKRHAVRNRLETRARRLDASVAECVGTNRVAFLILLIVEQALNKVCGSNGASRNGAQKTNLARQFGPCAD